MAKISKEEIQNLINESLSENANMSNNVNKLFNLKPVINSLIESATSNKDLMNLLERYNTLISKDNSSVSLYESFLNELSSFLSIKQVKKAYNALCENMKNHEDDYTALVLLERIENDMVRACIEEPLYDYINNKNELTLSSLREALTPSLTMSDANVHGIASIINEHFTMGALSSIGNVIGAGKFMNESEDTTILNRISKKETSINLEKLQESVENYINEKLNPEKSDSKTLSDITGNNNIRLNETISKIKSNRWAKNNVELMNIVEQYENALMQGVYEERLYETFIYHTAPHASYVTGLSDTLDELKDRVSTNKVNIDLTKILEEMLETTYYYIVPLIEESVVDYVNNKNAATLLQLNNALSSVPANPYCARIQEIINMDDDKRVTCCCESLVMNYEDKMKFINENAIVENIYSPVQYVNESETGAVFSIDNTFYIKSGNNIKKYDINKVTSLSESFIQLNHLINDPRVYINENQIDFYANDKHVKVYENYVEIDGVKESQESLRNLNEMFLKYDDFDQNFFIMTSCLLENFNNIANVDFAKRVTLKNNDNISVDILRLNENIYIITHNKALNENTFYSNVNPIQCKNIINSHMQMNVSDLFEDLLPNQDKIMKSINEAQAEYEDLINKYKSALARLHQAEKSAEGSDLKKIQDSIKNTEDKIKEIEKEYKEYQKDAEKLLNKNDKNDKSPEDDDEVQTSDKPMSDEEVEANKDELSTPINAEDGQAADIEADTFTSSEDVESQGIMDIISGSDLYTEEPEENNIEEDTVDDNSFDVEQIVSSMMDEEPVESSEESEIMSEETPETSVEDEAEMFKSDIPTTETTASESSSFKIVGVTFDQNIATGEMAKTGVVHVLVPYVTPQGTLTDDLKTFSFDIDENSQVQIHNDSIVPVDMYMAIRNEIMNNPSFSQACKSTYVPNSEPVEMEVEETPVRYEDEELSDDEPTDDFDINFEGDDSVAEEPVPDSDVDEQPSEENYDITLDDIFGDEDTDADDFFTSETEDVEDVQSQEPEIADEETLDSQEPTTEETPEVTIPTYVKDGTEIEMQAKDKDKSVIPESFVSITPEFEGVKKQVISVNEAEEDEIPEEDIIEGEEPEFTSEEIFEMMHSISESNVDAAEEDDFVIEVSKIQNEVFESEDGDELGKMSYFSITSSGDILEAAMADDEDEIEEESTTVYMIDEQIFSRPTEEFEQIMDDFEGEELIEALMHDYDDPDKEIAFATNENVEDCVDIVASIYKSYTGETYNIEEDAEEYLESLEESLRSGRNRYIVENIKIRKNNKLASEGSKDNKKTDDIVNGTKQEKDNEKEEELAQEEQSQKKDEAYHPKLPNQKMNEYASEPRQFNAGMNVIYKPLNMNCSINSKQNDGSYNITLKDGTNVSGVTKNQLAFKDDITLNTPAHFNFDDNNLTTDLTDFPAPKNYRDLNGKIDANIVVDGYRINNECVKVSLKDMLSKRSVVHAINEYGDETIFPKENIQIEEPETWPWGVYTCSNDNEPERKVRIYTPSYIYRNEDNMVVVYLNGEIVEVNGDCVKMVS